MILFRPTGLKEAQLVRDAGWQAGPPRSPDQPVFCPVTTRARADRIARDWNSARPALDLWGFGTRFEICAGRAGIYPLQQEGGRAHRELWAQVEKAGAFNAGLVTTIKVIGAFRDRTAAAFLDAFRALGL